MMEQLKYLMGHLYFLQAPLDREVWLDDKDGMEYQEEAPEMPDLNLDLQPVDAIGWTVILRYLAVAILIALLIFVIVRLIMRRNKQIDDQPGAVRESEAVDAGPTALSPMEELWAAYKLAKEEKNFREAVRLLYQIIIKHLDKQGRLKAAPDKTNREYTRELSWEEKASDFFKLTLLHEFIWYGDADVKQSDFERAEPGFIQFIESIKDG